MRDTIEHESSHEHAKELRYIDTRHAANKKPAKTRARDQHENAEDIPLG